ncbi:hypothetical protein QBC34DRAFT_23988 [Podospora aff. communis PSN243]|uniref:Uncharacterized protein n=1 Tax=Podospora aff. communis PSN243 TaxID=3040156 RepID=A0AAV9G305_9PEZI|nr:hypothetical protein QBC34DRAFT_23988 [Podospora aff. communis PSN243]
MVKLSKSPANGSTPDLSLFASLNRFAGAIVGRHEPAKEKAVRKTNRPPGHTAGPHPPQVWEFEPSVHMTPHFQYPPVQTSADPPYPDSVEQYAPGPTQPDHDATGSPTRCEFGRPASVPDQQPTTDLEGRPSVNNASSESVGGESELPQHSPNAPAVLAQKPEIVELRSASSASLKPTSAIQQVQDSADTSIPLAVHKPRDTDQYDISRPLCSLHLLCYRSGGRPPCRQQLITAMKSRFPDEQTYQSLIKDHPEYILTDEQLFEEMRGVYEAKMCGFFRRHLSLKSLRSLRLLSYTPTTRPVQVVLDDLVLQEMMRSTDVTRSNH